MTSTAPKQLNRAKCVRREGPMCSEAYELLRNLRPLVNLPPSLIPSETNHPPLMHRGYPVHETIVRPYATEHNLLEHDDTGEINWFRTWGKIWNKLDTEFDVGVELIQVWEVPGGALWAVQNNYDMIDPTKKPVPQEVWQAFGKALGYKNPPKWYLDMRYGIYRHSRPQAAAAAASKEYARPTEESNLGRLGHPGPAQCSATARGVVGTLRLLEVQVDHLVPPSAMISTAPKRSNRARCVRREGPMCPEAYALLRSLRPLPDLPPDLIPSETNQPPLMHQGYPMHETVVRPYAVEHNLLEHDDKGKIDWFPTWGNIWKKLDTNFDVGAELIQVWEVPGGALWVVQNNYDMVNPTKKPVPQEVWQAIGKALGYKNPPKWYLDMRWGFYPQRRIRTAALKQALAICPAERRSTDNRRLSVD
ncbi:hypothetical protein JAAARDRAFT_238031 [Jaapia argillacea MUCL 33604]|uniref:Uncharacterized protein n=1 Tax=Jaapia argillacea MUCL 33604 TaxID=933084 RepID=A0A067QMM4_9AGAM|nr:hypothetical protein JAAARDRAFT_238031 [Jaapia argillacea MUCL 33604]